MRKWLLLSVLFMHPGMGGTGLALADHDEVYTLRQEGKILPLSTLLEKAQAIVPGRLVEAELEREHGRWVYEIKMTTEDHRYVELYFDAATGEFIGEEQD